MIELRVRQALLQPRAPARLRHRHALIVADDHAVRVRRIDPHVVVIAAGRLLPLLDGERRAGVDRLAERRVEVVGLVVVVGRDRHPRVVRRAPHRVAVGVDHLPVLAAVVGSPELAALGVLPFPRHAVAGFDQHVHAVGVRVRDRGHHLADRFGGQAVARQLFPRGAAVARHEQPAARAAALAAPRVQLELPHAREEDARVARVHRDLRAAGVLVDEQRPLPRGAAVGRTEHAALLLWTVRGAERARAHDLRIGRIDHDAADAAGLLEAHVRPRVAGVRRFVDAVPDRDVAANPRLAGAGPDDVRIRCGHGQRADRLRGLIVEELRPVDAAVDRLRDPARRAAGVVDERIAGDADDRGNPVALGADEAPAQAAVDIGRRTRALSLRDERGARSERRENDENQFPHECLPDDGPATLKGSPYKTIRRP